MSRNINTILTLQDKFSNTLNKAKRNTLLFSNRLKSCEEASKGVESLLNKMAKTAVATGAACATAMGVFAVSAVKTYGEFQQSMSNVAGILGEKIGSENYKKLEEAAREAGKSTTKTAKEAADALSYMALAGWGTEKSIKGLMPVLRASEATGADLATTSDLITDSMSALGLKTNELQHYLDVCAKAQNKSNTSLTQLQEAYIVCGATFHNFNTNLDESGALLGVLANRGLKGSEAGNSLQSLLINLTKKSGESYKAMQALGISAYKSNGEFRGITETLMEVIKATENLDESERNNYLTMIGGKTQLTTLQGLIAGLTNVLDNGKTEFEDLRDNLKNCTGALDTMAKTMTDNYAGALARAISAADDLKLTLGKKLEPYITKFLNWFSVKLPGATEKFAIWFDSKLPSAIKICKAAFEKIKPIISFIINNFKNLTAVLAGTVVGLKAFTIITNIVKLWDKLRTAGTALRAVLLALNISVLASPWTWVAAAIGAVVAGLLVYKNTVEKVKQTNIASHFGDIALSAEECSKMVKNVFGQTLISQVDDINAACSNVEDKFNSLIESARELNKINFMFNLNHNNVSQEKYLETAQKYIDDIQEVINSKQYELFLNANFLFGEDSETANLFNEKSNNYFSQLLADAQEYGQNLMQSIEDGFVNGWDDGVAEKAIIENMQRLSAIQEKIKKAQAEAEMTIAAHDFTMGDLSQESFSIYLDKLQEQTDIITKATDEAAKNQLAFYKLLFGDDENSPTYESKANEIIKARDNKKAEALNISLSESTKAISEAYKDEYQEISRQLNDTISGLFIIDPDNISKNGEQLQGYIEEVVKSVNLDPGIKESIAGYLEQILPTVQEFEKIIDKNPKMWEIYSKTITSVEALKTIAGASNEFGKALVKGINTPENLRDMESAGIKLKNMLIKPFNELAEISMPIKIKYTTNTRGLPSSEISEDEINSSINIKGEAALSKGSMWEDTVNAINSTINPLRSIFKPAELIPQNAMGTPYFGGGLTWIHEKGGEIVDLPTGSRIYPADKSEKMVKSTPNITINVNIGSLYDSRDAADEIGEIICGKIVDAINSI